MQLQKLGGASEDSCSEFHFSFTFSGPLREEAASWAEKLKGVSEVLDTWLETQDLWQQLEAVFADHSTAKELPQEAKRFSMVDKSYVRLMRRAYDTRNIMQCCYGGMQLFAFSIWSRFVTML